MKKLKVIALSVLAFVTIASMVFVSCQKEQETFSCNTKINDKVIKNREANQNISRYDLAKLDDLDYQMGVFLSLSAENKVRIFNEKITAEQNNAHLNSGEKGILNEMISFLTPEHYTSLNSQFQNFAYLKETELRNAFGWDDAKVYIFTNSWMLEKEIEKYISAKQVAGGGSGGGTTGGGTTDVNGCTCFYSYYCWIKGGGSGTCESGNCKRPPGGCGVFGSTNCDGKCK